MEDGGVGREVVGSGGFREAGDHCSLEMHARGKGQRARRDGGSRRKRVRDGTGGGGEGDGDEGGA